MSASGTILVFAKAPVAGEAKTRLIPALGAADAAALHERLIGRTLATATETGFRMVLWCHPDARHPLFAAWRENRIPLETQTGDHLGERMYRAFTATKGPAVVIGTDCPDLTAGDLAQAFRLLATGNDAVLGPALDGGYWLLGLNRPDHSLFEGIDWGGNRVAAQTRQRLTALGWRWEELASRPDIDRPEDLRYLPPSFFNRIGDTT